jgi:hypothetical protein
MSVYPNLHHEQQRGGTATATWTWQHSRRLHECVYAPELAEQWLKVRILASSAYHIVDLQC